MKKAVVVCILVAVLACMWSSVAYASIGKYPEIPPDPYSDAFKQNFIIVKSKSKAETDNYGTILFICQNPIYKHYNGIGTEYPAMWYNRWTGTEWSGTNYFLSGTTYANISTNFWSKYDLVYTTVPIYTDGTFTDIAYPANYVYIEPRYINIVNPSPWENIYNQDDYIEINTNYEYWKIGAFKCQYDNTGGVYNIKLHDNGDPDIVLDGSGGERSYNPYDIERFYAENQLWVINGNNKKIKLSDLGVFDDGTYVIWYMAYTLDENGQEVAADSTYYSDIYFNYQEIVNAGSNDIVVTGIESSKTYYENVFFKIKKYGTSKSISLDIKLNDNLMWSDLQLPMYSLSLYRGVQVTDYRLVGDNNLKIINHATQEVIYEYDFELLPGLKPDGTPNTAFSETGIPNQNNQWDVIGFFDSIFKMIKSTVLLFDRATFGVSQNNNGLLIKMATVEKNSELLNYNIKSGVEFFKNIDLTLYGVSYNFYDIFVNIMSFLFGLFMIKRIKNVGLNIQDTITNTFEKIKSNFRG